MGWMNSSSQIKGFRELIRGRINTYFEASPSPSFFYDQFLGGRKETNDRVDDSGTVHKDKKILKYAYLFSQHYVILQM